MSAAGGWARRAARRGGLAGVWLVFVFLLLQGAGWLYFEVAGIQPIGGFGYPYGLYVADDALDYRLAANFSGNFHGAGYATIPIRTNGDGFRDDEFRRDAAGERIVVLGDSVVFGSGVREEDRFTEVLAAMRAGAGIPASVWNLGVNSYSFGHYLAQARADFVGLDPDLVVVGFTLNDIEPMDESWPARRFGTLRREGGSGVADWLRYLERRWDRSLAGSFLREAKAQARIATMDPESREAYHTRWMRGVETQWASAEAEARLGAEVDAFAALMRASGRAWMVLVFPELNTLLRPDEFSGARRRLHDLLQARGVAVCDAHAAFARHGDRVGELFLPDDSVHFTPAGHRLVAEVLADCLGRLPRAAG